MFDRKGRHARAASSPLSADDDLEPLFSLRSFLKNRLTKVLERCRLVLPSDECFFFCCFFFFCLSSDGKKTNVTYKFGVNSN